MRRILILALLYGGMQLLFPLGEQGLGSQGLLSFGFLILAAYTVGEIARGVGLPKIVGYLVAGIAFGPYALGALTAEGAARLTVISQLAIALIAFLAGAELQWAEVRERGVLLLKVMSAELLLGFAALFGLIYAFHDYLPFLRDASQAQVVAFALLFASIAIVHSPAVTLALLSETGARGPVARTTLGVVLLADVAVVLLFSGSLAVARAIAPAPGGGPTAGLGMLMWEILGALLVGALLGGAVALYLRFVSRELMLFAVIVAFFGLELARFAHVEVLLTLLTAGFVTENFTPRGGGAELRHAMERSAAPVFVVFFALSGAKIDLMQVAAVLPLVIPIALVRIGALWLGVQIGGRWAGVSVPERRYTWMGLVSQAGVAIGLAAIVVEAYPGMGTHLAALLLALVAINETLGPILFRRALERSGEIAAEPAAAASALAPGEAGR